MTKENIAVFLKTKFLNIIIKKIKQKTKIRNKDTLSPDTNTADNANREIGIIKKYFFSLKYLVENIKIINREKKLKIYEPNIHSLLKKPETLEQAESMSF
jgi:hypothetical protein